MANVIWTGGAPAVAQVSTITVGGTPATNDEVNVTIGNKTMTVTIGTSAATTAVAAELSASFNATSTTSPAPGAGYSRSVGGQEIVEFDEITATVDSSVVTLTGTAGIPFTVTVTDDGAGTYVVATTAGTGPNHVSEAENYLGGSLPADGDTVVCDRGSYDMSWDLDYFRGALKKFTLIRTTDYRGNIGLPPFHTSAASGNTHPEYRDRFLELYDGTSAFSVYIRKGRQAATGQGFTRLNGAGQSLNDLVVSADALANASTSVLEVIGGTWQDVAIRHGFARLEQEGELSANYMSIANLLTIGDYDSEDSETSVDIGVNCDFTNNSGVRHRSGNTTSRAVLEVNSGALLKVTGGRYTADLEDAATTHRDISIERDGIMEFSRTGLIGNIHVGSGATLDCSNASLLTVSSEIYYYKSCTVIDPGGAIASGGVFYAGCSQGDITAITGNNMNDTPGYGSALTV